MSAPNKIYVREYPDGVARFWEEKKKDDVVATIPHEYIRKDYLLEWAKGEQNKCSDETHPYAMFMNVVINKLNEI